LVAGPRWGPVGRKVTLTLTCVSDLKHLLTVVRLQKLLNGREVSVASTSLPDLEDLEDRTRSSCSLPLRVLPFSDPALPEGIRQVRLKVRDQAYSTLLQFIAEINRQTDSSSAE
jgi:hypothetical protein